MSDYIKIKYKTRAIVYDNIWMYFNKTAKEVIEDCKINQKKITGLEAFKLSGKGIQPDLEHSIDYDSRNGNWNEAIEFLSDEENADYLYEIWYDGY